MAAGHTRQAWYTTPTRDITKRTRMSGEIHNEAGSPHWGHTEDREGTERGRGLTAEDAENAENAERARRVSPGSSPNVSWANRTGNG
jgi:hypothetical protein